MEYTLTVDDFSKISSVFGVYDKNLRLIESKFGVRIFLDDNVIFFKGKKDKACLARDFVETLLKDNKQELTPLDVQSHFKSFQDSRDVSNNDFIKIDLPNKKKHVLVKSKGHKDYIKAIEKHDMVFAIGPAGSGKTYLAMAMAVSLLYRNIIKRIILTRPALEAGESLGFLPGGLKDKLNPYLRPLYDALYDLVDSAFIKKYFDDSIIEIAPLAYMRGRTINNSFIILDEAQNCTKEQLKMFITRLGFYSKAVITGDITQSDLPGGAPKGLIETLDVVKDIKDLRIVKLTEEDIVRHDLVKKIIKAYADSQK